MLYLREMGEGSDIKVQEFCRRCGYSGDPLHPDITEGGNIVVYERIIEGHIVEPRINEVLFADPAIPATNEVQCPNDKCPSRTGSVEPSAKYIVLNNDSLEMLYRCVHCEKIWKNRN